MEVNRLGGKLTITFDSQEEVAGLYAFLSGTIHEIPPEIAQKGQWLYGWFFTSIQKLAFNFELESSTKTMTAESSGEIPRVEQVVSNAPRKRKR